MRSRRDTWRRTTRLRYATIPSGVSKFWIGFPRRVGVSPTTSQVPRFFCAPPRVTTCTDTSLQWTGAGWVGEETMALVVRKKEGCRWDLVSLGEVMLRFDPGEYRIWTTRQFAVSEGGGEYNVARGLKRCFGLDAAIVTAFAKNPVGSLLQDLIYQGGVDSSLIRWAEYDGVGRTVRNGLNFTERGFGVRAALGCSDRGHTAVAALKTGEIDWEMIFGKNGARWFHTGGIFCALSETTPEVAIEAMQCARKHGVIISYDLNYRDSLWRSIGGKKRAQEVNRRIAPYVDVMLGNEEDFSAALGYGTQGAGEHLGELESASFRKMIEKAVA